MGYIAPDTLHWIDCTGHIAKDHCANMYFNLCNTKIKKYLNSEQHEL